MHLIKEFQVEEHIRKLNYLDIERSVCYESRINQKLCEENRIPGVIRFGRSWAIPKNAEKPVDGRYKQNRKGVRI